MDPKIKLPQFLLQVFNATQEEPIEDDVSIQSDKPTRKVDRTPMGEYIIPEGEKPLTSLGIPGPGPADYTPEIKATRCEPPHYSVAGRYKHRTPKLAPGPANYTTNGDMRWKNKRITVKGRTRSMYDEEASKACSDIGPAQYNVKVKEVGKTGPKYSMSTRHADHSLKSSLVPPTGLESPGPNFRPDSGQLGRGPMKTFGNSRKDKELDQTPGPADYTIKGADRGPSYSLAKRLHYKEIGSKENVPSPNTYDIGSTIGKSLAMSMTARREDLQAIRCGPSPNSYYLKSTLKDSSTAKSMKYRWFDEHVDYQPGPGDYEIKPEVVKERHPAYSCRQRTKLSYPDSKFSSLGPEISPGPANYDLIHEFKKNDSPAYSMGHRSKIWQDDERPGPNEYCAEQYPKPESETAPAFSMRKRLERPDINKVGPGPAAYNPQLNNNGPSYTMRKKHKILKAFTNPAPNKYTPPSEQTRKGLPSKIGTSFKSRASPWIYSGFKTSKLYEPTV